MKQNLGAAVAVLNHVARPPQVAEFVRSARAAGLTIPVIAAVATYTDTDSATALQSLPGLELEGDAVIAVLASADPVEAGIRTAVDEARSLLAIEGVAGVNVSGSASSRGWKFATDVKAEVGARIRAEQPA